MKLTFDEFMRQVNRACESIAGVATDDIADMPYHSYWEDGMCPREVAREVLEEAGFDDE